jgi:hypothetical protein
MMPDDETTHGQRRLPPEIHLPSTATRSMLITDRPGSRTWKVLLAAGQPAAVKHTTGTDGRAWQFAEREAAVLARLEPHHLVAAGATKASSWLATAWEDAPTLTHYWANLPAHRHAAAWAARQAAAALADTHASGWRHGDLQAQHLLCPAGRPARLLDWTFGQGPTQTGIPAIPYRGGYAHLTAPEIAEELLDTPSDHHITLTNAADVYTFGAVVFSIWNRQWPRNYDAGDPGQLGAPQIYSAISRPTSLRPMPTGWPAMASLVAAMLRHDPTGRPSIHHVVEELTAICLRNRPRHRP